MMKNGMRRLAAITLILSMAAASGCSVVDEPLANESSGGESAQTESAQESSEEGTSGEAQTVIRYRTWEDSDWQKLTNELIAKFEKENPDIHVEYEPVAGDGYQAKLSAELASGTGPDVCWVDNWTTTFETGVYLALDDLVEESGFDLSTFNQELLSMCSYDGKLYGLGGWLNSGMINYNKELFDQAGIPYPEAGWTWEECYQAAEAITSGEGGDKVYGIYLENWSASIENMVWNNGGAFIDEQNDYHVLNSAENAETLDFYTSFEKNGLSPDASTVKANGGLIDMFNSGKIAMVYFFPNIVVSARSGGGFELDNLGIVPMPVAEEGQLPTANILFTNPISITASSENPEAAFRFLTAVVGKEQQTEFCNRGYGLPADVSLVSALGMDTDPHMSVFVDPMIHPENYGKTRTYLAYSPISGIIGTEVQNAISRIVENGQAPQDALNEAVSNIESQELTQ